MLSSPFSLICKGGWCWQDRVTQVRMFFLLVAKVIRVLRGKYRMSIGLQYHLYRLHQECTGALAWCQQTRRTSPDLLSSLLPVRQSSFPLTSIFQLRYSPKLFVPSTSPLQRCLFYEMQQNDASQHGPGYQLREFVFFPLLEARGGREKSSLWNRWFFFFICLQTQLASCSLTCRFVWLT